MTPEGPGLYVGDGEDGEGPDIEDKSQGRFEEEGSEEASSKIIDDFEDQDMSEYDFEFGSFSEVISFNSSDKISGDVSLEVEDPDSDSGSRFWSLSGLENYPEAGDEFEVYFKFADGLFIIQFYFGAHKTTNDDCYVLNINRNGNLELGIYDNGFTRLAAKSISPQRSTWYKAVIDWGAGGNISADLIKNSDESNLATISTTDTTFTSGGIGFANGNTQAGEIYLADYARII